ncbi:MAG: hypothetical protein JET69_03150 [Methanomassiliicoccales archaeon]|nr:hypothetical protein [Methanomassiliicoccales archaeon]
MSDKDGDYCQVCGGITPGKVATKRVLINGAEIGIDKLDEIIDEVRGMGLSDDAAITEEILRRTRKFNYVPTKRSGEYGEALLKEYRRAQD